MDAAEVILPKVLQLLHLSVDQRRLRPVGEGHLVQLHRIHLEDVETCAIEHKLAAGEALGDDFLVHAHRLEKLCALVALQTGDAHLAHDLQDTSVRGFPEVLDALVQREVGPPDAEEAEVAKVGVDGIAAEAKEAAEVMDLMGIRSFHDQCNLRTELLGNEVLMYGTHGEERADRNTTLARAAVRQDEDGGAIAQNRGFGLLADLLQALLQQIVSSGRAVRLPGSRLRLAEAVGHVQHDGRHTVGLQTEESVVAARAEDRGVQEDTSAGLRGGLEEPPLRAHWARQRHHVGLTDRINRRIRGLRKELEEVVERLARHPGHTGQRHIGAHGAQGLRTGLHHGSQEHLHLLVGVAGVGEQRQHPFVHQSRVRGIETAWLLVEQLLDQRRVRLGLRTQSVLDLDAVSLQEVSIGLLLRIAHLQLVILDELPLAEVHQEHAAWTQASFKLHLLLWDIHDSDLGGENEPLVLGDVEAAWTEAVSIQRGAELDTIGEANQGRAIPRLHDAGQVLVESFLLRLHAIGILPSFRDHHHDNLCQLAGTCGEQELHDVVQQRRVTADVLVHGEESIQLRTAEGRGVVHQCLPGADRVAIACQSVDLAVVGNASERVGTVPRWEGVRRETRVHDCQEGCALLRLEVQVVLEKLVGLELALVHNRAGRKGAHKDLAVTQRDGAAEEEEARLQVETFELLRRDLGRTCVLAGV
mmetsp:Transcript_39529/g.92596  ORF Transcript_39529/g.92596 Transcript_39529/m.92596 type:complete len:700 (+) Transcript_39529:1005-3104(+)